MSDSEEEVLIEDETSDVNIDLINSSTEELPPTPKKKIEKKKYIYVLSNASILRQKYYDYENLKYNFRKESKKEQKSITESILAAAHEARRKLLEKHPNQMVSKYQKKFCYFH